MTKALVVDPRAMRARGELRTAPIPVNAYTATIDDERRRLGDDRLRRILRDMLLVREFETLLDLLKRDGAYRGVAYEHRGPAHLAIGQEAAAVGGSFLLRPEDHIFGSHRSHGEILAKGLAAIEIMDPAWLRRTLETHLDGAPLRVLERHLDAADERARAVQFLVYGLLAEIFARENGFNRGLGGSMHAFFAPFGIYPNNAIVGGSADLAVGAALFKRVRRAGGIVVANLGDGSVGSGPVWEAMNFATMGQFRTLWSEEYRGGLPVVFFFVDNFYAMGGQTFGETMGYERLARIGAGLNEHSMHAETVDGNNPLAVVDAMRRAREILDAGDGPVLLDVACYRQSGHSPSDAGSYRSREEVAAWRAVDPIVEYGDRLEAAGVIAAAGRRDLSSWAQTRVEEAFRLAADLEVSPRLDLRARPDAVRELMFANSSIESRSDAEGSAELAMPIDQSSRLREHESRSRFGRDADGRVLPSMKALTLRGALFEAIVDAFASDPTLVAYGQENRDWGGAFGVYRGLTELLPYHRLFNAPISEAAIVGTAVGYAMEGGRALVELMYADFIGRAGDELFNQLAKWRAMSGGLLRLPVVVRVSVGARYGAQHSQEWTALLAHIPGLKVVYPVTPYDAKGLLASSLAGDDPVIFFESQRLYDTVELFHQGGVPRESYRVPLGEPDVKRAGKDLTILTVGATLYRALDAADQLSRRFGLEAEVIDARSLVPFDYATVVESVRKTKRILLASDASERGSFLHTLATNIQSLAFDDLEAPVAIIGAPNTIALPAELEEFFVPQSAWLLDAIHQGLIELPGYVLTTDQSAARRAEIAGHGV